MGTRSVVAVPTGETSWKGRYVHWDGYPDGVGRALVEIIARDGVERAVKTITEDHWGWSILNGEENQGLAEYQQDGRFGTVPGYGVPYNKDTEGGDQPDEWITDVSVAESWVEYVYVIQSDGKVKAYRILGHKLKLLSTDLATQPA